MRFDAENDTIQVFLSERNLKALLAKLNGHPANSVATLCYVNRDGVALWVTAEHDAEHYANPERDTPTPGRMHPETEGAL